MLIIQIYYPFLNLKANTLTILLTLHTSDTSENLSVKINCGSPSCFRHQRDACRT